MRGAVKAPLSDGGHAASSTHGEIGGLVNQPPDLDQVEENRRVDGPRSWGIVVYIRDGLENLGG